MQQVLPTVEQRLAVNAAINDLIYGENINWILPARVIVDFSTFLKQQAIGSIEIFSEESGGPNVSGYAPGVGNVDVKGDKSKTKKEFSLGVSKERVGYYRIWLKSHKGKLAILFHRFEKSSVSTVGLNEYPETYYLGYDPQTKMPVYFAMSREETFFSLGYYSIFREYLEVKYGYLKNCFVTFGLQYRKLDE